MQRNSQTEFDMVTEDTYNDIFNDAFNLTSSQYQAVIDDMSEFMDLSNRKISSDTHLPLVKIDMSMSNGEVSNDMTVQMQDSSNLNEVSPLNSSTIMQAGQIGLPMIIEENKVDFFRPDTVTAIQTLVSDVRANTEKITHISRRRTTNKDKIDKIERDLAEIQNKAHSIDTLIKNALDDQNICVSNCLQEYKENISSEIEKLIHTHFEKQSSMIEEIQKKCKIGKNNDLVQKKNDVEKQKKIALELNGTKQLLKIEIEERKRLNIKMVRLAQEFIEYQNRIDMDIQNAVTEISTIRAEFIEFRTGYERLSEQVDSMLKSQEHDSIKTRNLLQKMNNKIDVINESNISCYIKERAAKNGGKITVHVINDSLTFKNLCK